MMQNFRNWYVRNQDAITWFVIGLLTMSTIDYTVKGDWIWAAISAVLIWANYKLSKVRFQ